MMNRRHKRVARLVPQGFLAMGSYEFCPWMDRYVRWLKRPIGWFVVGAAVSALTALTVEPRAWIVVAWLVGILSLGVIWPWLAIKGIATEIVFDRRRCREGDCIQVRLSIHNRWPWPLWGLAVENGFFFSSDEMEEQPVAALARIPGWSRSEFVFPFEPSARGVYPHRNSELTTAFPFGIWRASQEVAIARKLLVWPRTTPLASIPSTGGDIVDIIGTLFDRPGNEGEMIGVRPYRGGDRLRSIHWAQTARRDTLIVNERQAAARRLIVVAVDTVAFTNHRKHVRIHQEVLETAIRVAASIAREFHAHHANVRFVMGDVDLTLSPDRAGLHRLFDALARFRPDKNVVSLQDSFAQGVLTVLLTTGRRRTVWENVTRSSGPVRFVEIDHTSLSDGSMETKTGQHNVWIKIDHTSDDGRQLRRQWERLCHVS